MKESIVKAKAAALLQEMNEMGSYTNVTNLGIKVEHLEGQAES